MIVLASASPRRRELLRPYIPELCVCPADIDERLREGEAVEAYVRRLAYEKNARVRADRSDQDWVIAADTSVAVGTRILGKPENFAHAAQMWDALQGRWHQVWTGVCVAQADQVLQVQVVTEVWLDTMDEQARQRYWHSGEPQDKAGAYAIQGCGGMFVRAIRGSYSNVVGLPLLETAELLQHLGYRLW